MAEFIYTLKLKSAKDHDNLWGPSKHMRMDEHYQYLHQLKQRHCLLFSGKTLNHDSTAFEIVVLQTESAETAGRIMSEDPLVKSGFMQAMLFPFGIDQDMGE